jgi:heptaprenyl diphosphate synthase
VNRTRKLAYTSVTIALALVLSYVETLIPGLVAVPGVKVGLANIAVVFALYRIGLKEAVVISLMRVVLSSLLFGSAVSLAYSFAGATVSLVLMAVLKKTKIFSVTGVSTAGAVSHNLAQVGVACLLLETTALAWWIPVLLVSGTLAGVVIGLVSAVTIKRIPAEEDDAQGN